MNPVPNDYSWSHYPTETPKGKIVWLTYFAPGYPHLAKPHGWLASCAARPINRTPKMATEALALAAFDSEFGDITQHFAGGETR